VRRNRDCKREQDAEDQQAYPDAEQQGDEGAVGLLLEVRIQNKAGFLRETILKEIVRRFNDEHPTLWEENEPDLFNQRLI
jgi:hypothetical protein